MRIGSAQLIAGVQRRWELDYVEAFHDGWHHTLSVGPVWIDWYTWNRVFWRWRDKSEDPACHT